MCGRTWLAVRLPGLHECVPELKMLRSVRQQASLEPPFATVDQQLDACAALTLEEVPHRRETTDDVSYLPSLCQFDDKAPSSVPGPGSAA